MSRLLILVAATSMLLFGAANGAKAQTQSALTVSACGGQTLNVGQFFPLTMDTTGKLCGSATAGSSNVTIVPQTTATITQGVCTIATGGTPLQCISAAQNTNGYLLYVSPGFSNTDPIYCSDSTTTTTASTTGAMPLNPSTATTVGGSFTTPSFHTAGKAVWCVGATTGDKIAYTVN